MRADNAAGMDLVIGVEEHRVRAGGLGEAVIAGDSGAGAAGPAANTRTSG